MSIAFRPFHDRFVILSTVAALAALCVVSAPNAARAQAQSAAQQACLNGLYKAGAKLTKAQGKTNSSCVQYDQKLQTGKLGNPGQELTTDACLTNDPKGKLAKAAAKVADVDCSSAPTFGSAGANRVAGASSSQSRAVLRDVFGPNLNDIVLYAPAYGDDAGAACHTTIVKDVAALNNALWSVMAAAAKDALSGKNGPAAASATDLASAISAALEADAAGKIASSVTTLGDDMVATCEAATKPIFQLFRGSCAGAADGAELATCALHATRCRFCRGTKGATDLPFDCDTFDDGAANDSCVGFASAHVITNPAELITGPLADGQVGDYLIENEVARFVIQKPAVRDIYSVGAFGGNIIDAELVGHPGMDNFLEIQPALNIETVVNAQTLEILNDGADGGAAIVRTCGPDDVLDFVNPSTVIEDAGLDFPALADDNDQDVEACTTYTLEPDATYLQLVTTVFNNEAPAGCAVTADCGFGHVCAGGSCKLPMFVGDFVNAAGELEQWASGDAGVGVQLTADMGVLSYVGYGRAQGVDYGITTVEIPESHQSTSYFSTSGVSYILHSQAVLDAIIAGKPEFVVGAGESKSFTRYFGVGDGSGGNAIDLENLVKAKLSGSISGCVTVNGVPAPGAHVTAGPKSGSNIGSVTSTWVTGADGCYAGTLPVANNYGVAAWREGAPYEGGGSSPLVHTVAITATTPVVQDIDLPATGHVSVTVVDESSAPVPARVSVVGFDPSADPLLSGNTGLFRDLGDVFPFGIARALYSEADGTVDFDMEPGSYRIYVSRGGEYSLFEQALTVTAGATANVSAQIARVVDTPGFISSDHHVHGIASADSRVSDYDRVHQFAGEGVDNIIMTDHHAHTDLIPQIDALGFTGFVTATIGEEITTWDTGHYNGYPFTIDPTRPSGGSTDWGGAAAAGADFPSLGSYILEPAAIELLAQTGPTATPDTIVQINHIDSHFVPMKIDTSLVPPQSGLDAAGRLRFRMNPAGGELYHHFKALELWNGDNRTQQSHFLNERIGIWFNHLNQGLPTTAIADTDTHAFANLESAGARSWCASSTDDPALMSPGEIAQSVGAGRCVGGQGIYVQTRLVDAANPSNVADLTLGGGSLLAVTNPVAGLTLEIKVQAPLWAEFDRIQIFANATTIPSPTQPAVAELFGATPTMTLTAPADFTISTNNVFPLVAGGSRREATVNVPFTNMTDDTWFVVVVKGTDGVSKPMFPVHPAQLQQSGNGTLAGLTDGNLGQSGTMALAFTNALYADVDGSPGFDAPLAP
jgi:hypothetical protein